MPALHSMIRTRLRAFFSASQGIASVEFALILPLLALLLFGAVEIGRMVSDYQAVTKGVRDATRYLTRVDGVDCSGAGAGTVDATRLAEARNMALAGQTTTPTSEDLRLFYWSDPESIAVTVTCHTTTLADGTVVSGLYASDGLVPEITVTANVNFLRLFGDLIVQADGGTFAFAVTHTQLHIGS